jgi:hypothetical protein
LESRKIAGLVQGVVLLAVAVVLAVFLWRYFAVLPLIGKSVKTTYYFPIAITAGICWVTYRGIRIIVSAMRDPD